MERYDYEKAVMNDITDYLKESGVGYVDEDKRQELEDDMFVSDSVTGNGSGSYTFSTWVAEENLCHNLDLLHEAMDAFGAKFEEGAESNDVLIRCYLLNQCFTKVLEKWNEEHPETENEEDESDETDE